MRPYDIVLSTRKSLKEIQMSTVLVSLDTNAKPPVTCAPETLSVTELNENIMWIPESGQTFTFKSLKIKDDPSCFKDLVVTDDQVSVTDENDGGGDTDYPYTLKVILDGKEYSSHTSEAGGTGGSPSINNK
jgi:hypothetical protein